jgi:proteasome accessory factor C
MTARRTTAASRLRRLLAMIPWLAANDGPTVADVCARFDITRSELQQDLELLTLYVGVPPYSPERLFHVTIEGGRVFAHLTPALDRPLRLSPDEAVALVVAGQALADVPGAESEGALARALAKVAALLGVDPADAVDIDLGTASVPALGTLRAAVAAGRQVEIEHVSATGERRTRTVDPWQVVHEGAAWYLVGHDHLRREPRWFRVDRIVTASMLEGRARPAPGGESGRHPYEPAEDDPRVALELAPSARWVVETYPVEDVDVTGSGAIRATLAIGSVPFLESLLVRLGPDARVLDAPPALADAGREGARRVLARYR